MILIKDYAPFSADFKRDEVAQFIYSILVDDED